MQYKQSSQKSKSNLWLVADKQSLSYVCYELYLHRSQLDVADEALTIVISALLLGSYDTLTVVGKENEAFICIKWRESAVANDHSTLDLIYKFLDSYATISPAHKKEASGVKEFLLNESALPF